MQTSEWIAVGGIVTGLLATTIGSTLYLSFKIGGVNEKVNSLGVRMDSMEIRMNSLEGAITEIRVDIAEMRVKVDSLWRDYLDKKANTKAHP
ncbi:MAG: hypothetical protein WDO15_03875 [Bacteroidota bacterium]